MTPDDELAALIIEVRTGLKIALVASERMVSVVSEAHREDFWQTHSGVEWLSKHFEAAVARLRADCRRSNR